ncbi:MAG: Chitobiase/beta-hexosaminidase C-terminal domain-containing protein [Verrucomicrobia bacterium]|nr:MAG: Chitobiase/beta-hexosaminidase C-terminal domain-containing protein [Verrucomicrobiota bacterium]
MNTVAKSSPFRGRTVRFPKLLNLPAALLVGLILAGGSAVSLEPPTAAQLQEARIRGDLQERLQFVRALANDQPSASFLRLAKAKIEEAAALAQGNPPPSPTLPAVDLPTVGSPKILTILIDFSDSRAPAAPSPAFIRANLYESGTQTAQGFLPYESLNRYYSRASERRLNLQGNVLGWYRFPSPRSSYTPAAGSTATQLNQAIFDLLEAALNSFDSSHDFSQYDNNDDGVIDAVTILFTGGKSPWGTFWSGYEWSFSVSDAASTLWDGKRVKNFVFQPFETRGTNGSDFDPRGMIHQMGHLLGLPDYFDASPEAAPTGGVGGLDQMDGLRGNHNAFSRWVLGWIQPTIIGRPAPATSITLNASGDTALVESANPGRKAAAIFPTPATDPYSFFLVENRFRIGNDLGTTTVANSTLPADGLLIWQVNAQQVLDGSGNPTASQNDNSGTTPKLLRLIEGDGLSQIDLGRPADLGDYYNSAKLFTPTSKPPSNDAQGRPTNVSVTRISANGRTMTALVTVPAISSTVVAAPVIAPAGGVFTTPVNNVTLTCSTPGAAIYYTLDGSTPTNSSPSYTGPLTISAATAILRARAVKSGMTDSPLASATFTYAPPTELTSGVARASQAGNLGAMAYYVINVPAGQTRLEISTTGATGDADLYVKRGSLPTLSDYDFRPFLPGNIESVVISNPAEGPWFIMLHGYQAYSAVSLTARFTRVLTTTVAAPVLTPGRGTYVNLVRVGMTTTTTGATIRYTTDRSAPTPSSPAYTGPVELTQTTQLRARSFLPNFAPSTITTLDYTITAPDASTAQSLTRNVSVGPLIGLANSFRYFRFDVPADQNSLVIRTFGGSGNCDIYVNAPGRTGSALPTLSDFDYRPYALTNNETVTITDPPAGTWYVLLHGFSSYSSMGLIADYSRLLGQVATPQFSPLPGIYNTNSVQVGISCATEGAVIRYTTDGSTPTESSPVFSSPIILNPPGQTIRAQAFAPGYTPSSSSSASYTVNAISPDLSDGVKLLNISGAINTDQVYAIRVLPGQSKLLISTLGGTGDCDLYVRRDLPPDTNSFDFQSAKTGNAESVEIASPEPTYYYVLLHATRAFSGVSLLADFSTTLPVVPAPVITPAGGTFDATPVTVGVTCTLAGATIHYTTNGDTPTTSSPTISGPLSLTLPDGSSTGSVTLRALAVRSGFTPSAIVFRTFNLSDTLVTLTDGVRVSVPTSPADTERHFKITVPSGQAQLNISTSISTGASGDCDLYVRYGAKASRTSFDYAPRLTGNVESVTINSPAAGEWFIMLAANSGLTYRNVSLLAQQVAALETVATPAFSVAAGSYNVQVTVGLSCATPGATIRFTTDGSEPTAASSSYTGPIRLTATTTLKAKAFKLGSNSSATATAVYTVDSEPPSFDTGLSNGVAGLSGAQGSQSYFKFTIPPGDSNDRLTISTVGSSGDSDLFVKFGSPPSSSSFDFRPSMVTGSNETVVIQRANVANWEGSWYLLLVGQQAYSNLSVRAVLEATSTSVATPTITTAAATTAIPTTAVTIRTTTTGSTLYYTLDNSTPTVLSSVYTVPFALPSAPAQTDVTVRALAVKSGQNPATASATFTVPPAQITTLTNGVTATNLGNLTRSLNFFKITVPSDAADRLTITTSGVTGTSGDCDLYVRYGSAPTLSVTDFKSGLTGFNESVTIPNPTPGDWFIMLEGVAVYSKLNLTATATGKVAAPTFSPAPGHYVQSTPLSVTLSSATNGADISYSLDGTTFSAYTGPVELTATGNPATITAFASKAGSTNSNRATGSYTVSPTAADLTSSGQASDLSGVSGTQRYFAFTVPANAAFVKFAMTGTGDADLYVRKNSLPTLTDYDDRPGLAGTSQETVTIENPSPGSSTTYYAMVRGVGTFSGVALQVTQGATIGTVATPVITPADRTSSSSIPVSISCSTALATILYTTDGSTPSPGSPGTITYTGPFVVSTNVTPGTSPAATVVRAIAVRSLYANSETASATYSITGAPSVADLLVGTSNKLVSLHNDPAVYPSADTQASVYYKVTMPAGATTLSISTYNDVVPGTGGSTNGRGDADLYIRKGDLPTLSQYDQRPYMTGNFESVLVTGAPGDVFYIMLYRYLAYAGVTLEARDATGFSITEITTTPRTFTGLSAPGNDYRYFKVTVPSFAKRLQFTTSGGLGDCDLYAAYNHLPMPVYEYVSRRRGNSDSIVVSSPEAGVWYVLLQAFATSYSGVTFNVSITQ